MEAMVWLGLAVAGVIHLLPVAGLAGRQRLADLYGIGLEDQNLLILMRHRAVLFGILGLLMLASIGVENLRWPALSAGLVSAASFIAIAAAHRNHSPRIKTVVRMDWLAILGLGVAAAGLFFGK